MRCVPLHAQVAARLDHVLCDYIDTDNVRGVRDTLKYIREHGMSCIGHLLDANPPHNVCVYACQHGSVDVMRLFMAFVRGGGEHFLFDHGIPVLIEASLSDKTRLNVAMAILEEWEKLRATQPNKRLPGSLSKHVGPLAVLIYQHARPVDQPHIRQVMHELYHDCVGDDVYRPDIPATLDVPDGMADVERLIFTLRRGPNNRHVPDEFQCPFSGKWMMIPVVADDGHSYDRVSIDERLQAISPLTGKRIDPIRTPLILNRALAGLIQRHLTTGTPDDTPDEILCPISRDVMVDPVILSDGHSYDRANIVQWFQSSTRLTSPLTRASIDPAYVIPNHALAAYIRRITADTEQRE